MCARAYFTHTYIHLWASAVKALVLAAYTIMLCNGSALICFVTTSGSPPLSSKAPIWSSTLNTAQRALATRKNNRYHQAPPPTFRTPALKAHTSEIWAPPSAQWAWSGRAKILRIENVFLCASYAYIYIYIYIYIYTHATQRIHGEIRGISPADSRTYFWMINGSSLQSLNCPICSGGDQSIDKFVPMENISTYRTTQRMYVCALILHAHFYTFVGKRCEGARACCIPKLCCAMLLL